MKNLLKKKSGNIRFLVFVFCILFSKPKICSAEVSQDTKNSKYGLVIQPIEDFPIYSWRFIGSNFIYCTIFYESEITKKISLNYNLGYFMNSIAYKYDDSVKQCYSFKDHFLIFPLAIKFYPFSNKFSIFGSVEFHLHLTTKEYSPENADSATKPDTVNNDSPRYKECFSKNYTFQNISHLRWSAGIDYEFNFGLILALKYESTFADRINQNSENINHDISGIRFLTGINISKIIEYSQIKAEKQI